MSKPAPPAATYEDILARERQDGEDPSGQAGGSVDLVAAALAGLPEGDEACQLAAMAAAGGGSLEVRPPTPPPLPQLQRGLIKLIWAIGAYSGALPRQMSI